MGGMENVNMKTLNEITYGMAPHEMGTTGLVKYVRGHHWPYIPESTCFAARMDLAVSIIVNRYSARAAEVFRKAVHAS